MFLKWFFIFILCILPHLSVNAGARQKSDTACLSPESIMGKEKFSPETIALLNQLLDGPNSSSTYELLRSIMLRGSGPKIAHKNGKEYSYISFEHEGKKYFFISARENPFDHPELIPSVYEDSTNGIHLILESDVYITAIKERKIVIAQAAQNTNNVKRIVYSPVFGLNTVGIENLSFSIRRPNDTEETMQQKLFWENLFLKNSVKNCLIHLEKNMSVETSALVEEILLKVSDYISKTGQEINSGSVLIRFLMEKALSLKEKNPGVCAQLKKFATFYSEQYLFHRVGKESIEQQKELLITARNQFEKILTDEINNAPSKDQKDIINTHLLILNDPGSNEKIMTMIETNNLRAAYAIYFVFQEKIDLFKKLTDPGFQKLAADLESVRRRWIEQIEDTMKQKGLNPLINKTDEIAKFYETITELFNLYPPNNFPLESAFLKELLLAGYTLEDKTQQINWENIVKWVGSFFSVDANLIEFGKDGAKGVMKNLAQKIITEKKASMNFNKKDIQKMENLLETALNHLMKKDVLYKEMPSSANPVMKLEGILDYEQYQRYVKEIPHLSGFIATSGVTAHYAVLAREDNIPVVQVSKEQFQELKSNSFIALDTSGTDAEIYINPAPWTLKKLHEKNILLNMKKEILQEWTKKEIVVEGRPVSVECTYDPKFDQDDLKKHHSNMKTTNTANIGLVRTEGLYENDSLPTEEFMTSFYTDLLKEAEGKVTIRTFDHQPASDKKLKSIVKTYPSLEGDETSGMDFYKTEIGRAILKTQLRALYSAGYTAKEKKSLKILIPMVETHEDINFLESLQKEVITEIAGKISAQNPKLRYSAIHKTLNEIPFGFMVETDTAVINIEEILETADFINIGLNDLYSSVLAINRVGSDASPEFKAKLKQLEASVVSRFENILEEADRAGKSVCFCGENASMPELLAYVVHKAPQLKNTEIHLSMTTNQIAETKSVLHLLDPKELHAQFTTLEPGLHERVRAAIAPTINNISQQAEEIAQKMLEANPESGHKYADPFLMAA